MHTVTFADEILGSGVQHCFALDVVDQHMTAKELIRQRIYEEVTAYNVAQLDRTLSVSEQHYHGLVKPSTPKTALNWEQQYQVALEGFNRNAFIMLVNDQQIEHLEQSFDLRTATTVTFLKLVPLVGG